MRPIAASSVKWADKYGIKIDVTQFNDYVESMNQYTAGAFDAVDAHEYGRVCRSRPPAASIRQRSLSATSRTAMMPSFWGDKSALADIKGQNVNLVEFPVSALPACPRRSRPARMTERDVKVVNTSDADMVAAYKTADVTAVVTWNPLVSTILEDPSGQEGASIVRRCRARSST